MSFPGGKAGDGVYQRLINLIPPHKVYVEGCLGGGAILKYKRLAQVSFGFDLDGSALDGFDYGGLLEQGAAVTRDEPIKYQWFKEHLGYTNLWRFNPVPVVRLAQLDVLQALQHSRKHLGGSDFVYLDPPYLRSSRKSSGPIYRHEWTDDHHRRMLELVQTLPCMVMISGYWSEMYAQALKGWRVVSFQASTRGGTATEYVWMNYPEPKQLHDYRHLGEGWVERQRIRRKVLRWVGKLEAMPALERYAVMDALQGYLSQVPQTEAARGPGGDPLVKSGLGREEGSRLWIEESA